jgi:hypothetical protein
MTETNNIKRAIDELRAAQDAIRDAQDSMEAANSEALSAAGTRLKPYFDMYRRRVQNVVAFRLREQLCADIEARNASLNETYANGLGDSNTAIELRGEIAGLRRALDRVRAL